MDPSPGAGGRGRAEILEDSRATLRQAQRHLDLLSGSGPAALPATNGSGLAALPVTSGSGEALVRVRQELEVAVRALHLGRAHRPGAPPEPSALLLEDVEERLHRVIETLGDFDVSRPPDRPATWGTCS